MKRINRIHHLTLSKPIFRIDSLDRFYEVLNKKVLTFVRPSKWEDPMENILFNADVTLNGREFIHPGKENIYGQCWTIDSDNYALWQIYRKDNIGVWYATRF